MTAAGATLTRGVLLRFTALTGRRTELAASVRFAHRRLRSFVRMLDKARWT